MLRTHPLQGPSCFCFAELKTTTFCYNTRRGGSEISWLYSHITGTLACRFSRRPILQDRTEDRTLIEYFSQVPCIHIYSCVKRQFSSGQESVPGITSQSCFIVVITARHLDMAVYILESYRLESILTLYMEVDKEVTLFSFRHHMQFVFCNVLYLHKQSSVWSRARDAVQHPGWLHQSVGWFYRSLLWPKMRRCRDLLTPAINAGATATRLNPKWGVISGQEQHCTPSDQPGDVPSRCSFTEHFACAKIVP